MAVHTLDPAADTVADFYSPDAVAVLQVDPGDTVVVRSLDASGSLERQQKPGETVPHLIPEARGHCLTGPIAVRGARPGQTLAVHFQSLQPAEWGWTVSAAKDNELNRRLGLGDADPAWLLWDVDSAAGTATNDRGHTVRLAPFLGVTGVAPSEPGEHSTIPPRPVGGGNIDCRELVAGSTLYLPVAVPEALLYMGDGHAAQGDGEVSGTAIECGMTTTARLELVEDLPVPGIHARTPAGLITFGFSEDLNEANVEALGAMLTWMQKLYDLDRATALTLASPSVSMRVTQVANDVWGVHALLPEGAIA